MKKKIGIRVVEKKHFHIAVSGTYSVKADSLEEATEVVNSWFNKADASVCIEETDDNERCDYCPETKAIKPSEHLSYPKGGDGVTDVGTYITPTCKEVPLPSGLQDYINSLALNVLYSEFHKSTNGIWCNAEVTDYGTYLTQDDTERDYWEVGVGYGKTDEGGVEQYHKKIYVLRNTSDIGWEFQYHHPEIEIYDENDMGENSTTSHNPNS